MVVEPQITSIDEDAEVFGEHADALRSLGEQFEAFGDFESCFQALFLFFAELVDLKSAGTHCEICLGSRYLRFARIAVLCN